METRDIQDRKRQLIVWVLFEDEPEILQALSSFLAANTDTRIEVDSTLRQQLEVLFGFSELVAKPALLYPEGYHLPNGKWVSGEQVRSKLDALLMHAN